MLQQVFLKHQKEVKKLVLVLATFTLVTIARKKAVETAETTGTGKNDKDSKYLGTNLARVLCIRYHILIWIKSVLALFNLGSEFNIIYSTFVKELGLSIRWINIEAHKIDGIILNTSKIEIVAFLVTHKANLVRFFEKIFLGAKISLEIVFKISFFLTLSSTNIDFLDQKLG